MTNIIRYAQGGSSLGTFVSALSDRGLVMLEFGDLKGTLVDELWSRFPEADLVHDPAFMQTTLARLTRLIEHPEVHSDLPVDMRGTEFELRVWDALRDIPAGQTVNYGEIATKIGAPRESREVAEACAANTLAVVVPCHRVVKKDGSISGYRWGFKRKRALIEREHRGLFQLA
jgi:AraC family transcriptional regulator, regulatory protein of adaptative response / methylated-DNA-[protein]-cysteine methyltransferase